MKINKVEHQQILLKLIEGGTFSGAIIELVLELKQSIVNAEVPEVNEKEVKKD